MIDRFLPLCVFALLTVSTAQIAPNENVQPPSTTPTIQGTLNGPAIAVFETPKDSCISNDIPDAMARAFRDYTGTIHFVAASSDMFQSLGPTLDTLQHNCEAPYFSVNDGNPGDYNDTVWLDSFYTFDGKTIAALSHTEYHGWSFPGECHSSNLWLCEYDSDTYHQSNDGGYHFDSFNAPNNYVAGVPFQYIVDSGPVGYSVDTNIVEYDGWYYAGTTDDGAWPPNCTGQSGPNPCLVPSGGAPIRTKNVFDPTSWRGWDGKDFTVAFADPYVAPILHPEQHVYTPVTYMAFPTGLNIYEPLHVAVATLWDYWDNELGPPGMYLTTSTDMVHWTTPTLVVTLAQIVANNPAGNWTFAYFSLIDPNAPDPSFSIIGSHPYLYYVRLDNNGQDRVLFRQKITLTPVR
jgi:hypothetical protein